MAIPNLPPPLQVSHGELAVGRVPCRRLADRFGTPLYVMDASRIVDNYRRLAQAFLPRYSRVRILYAVKANPSVAILRLLRREGAGVDVSGPGEIHLAQAAGFLPREMLCTPSFPSDTEIDFAVRRGVPLNLDLPNRIPPARSRGRNRLLSLRVNPGFGKGGHPGIVTGGYGSKFGVPEASIIAAYRRALRLGYRRFGLQAMTGSNVMDPSHFVRVSKVLTSIAGRVRRALGVDFEFLDLGGGFGIPYRWSQRPLDVGRLGARVIAAHLKGCDEEDLGRPGLWMEPGRYLVGDAGMLLTRVTGIRPGRETFVGVDAGMAAFLRPALYGAYHEVLPVTGPRKRPWRKVTICGPICENTDLLARNRAMPRLQTGDLLVVMNAGAYGSAMASNYNGRLRPPEVLVDGGRVVLARRGEGLRDLLRNQAAGPR